jgi:CheY-like chemotaxis protein
VLVIRDTGVGMSPEVLEHSFEPFFSTKGEQGTGLGLATVHGIVSQLGGRIEVDSQVGSGTTFTLRLPSGDPEVPRQPAAEAAPLPAPGGDETVLIVEDEAAVRKVLARVLRQQGYEVLESESFDSALQAYRSRRDDIRLVISDLTMPGRSGHELVAELLADQPGLPVVLLSAYPEGGTLGHAEPAPGIVMVQKPPAFDQLLRVVRRAVDEAGKGREEGEGARGAKR